MFWFWFHVFIFDTVSSCVSVTFLRALCLTFSSWNEYVSASVSFNIGFSLETAWKDFLCVTISQCFRLYVDFSDSS